MSSLLAAADGTYRTTRPSSTAAASEASFNRRLTLSTCAPKSLNIKPLLLKYCSIPPPLAMYSARNSPRITSRSNPHKIPSTWSANFAINCFRSEPAAPKVLFDPPAVGDVQRAQFSPHHQSVEPAQNTVYLVRKLCDKLLHGVPFFRDTCLEPHIIR